MSRELRKAVAYMRTSSKTNVGVDKDSDKRQLAAIEAYARTAGLEIVDTFYDTAVSGADPVTDRLGFAEMLERSMSNGARTIVVESPDRFARDLMVQLAGHDMLKAKGVTLIAASAPCGASPNLARDSRTSHPARSTQVRATEARRAAG
jgi:DNA invertase Pin-like site-specific DNA recombinase